MKTENLHRYPKELPAGTKCSCSNCVRKGGGWSASFIAGFNATKSHILSNRTIERLLKGEITDPLTPLRTHIVPKPALTAHMSPDEIRAEVKPMFIPHGGGWVLKSNPSIHIVVKEVK